MVIGAIFMVVRLLHMGAFLYLEILKRQVLFKKTRLANFNLFKNTLVCIQLFNEIRFQGILSVPISLLLAVSLSIRLLKNVILKICVRSRAFWLSSLHI